MRCIAVLLGASDYPDYPGLAGGAAFRESKALVLSGVRRIVQSDEHILDLFDSGELAPTQSEAIADFVTRHASEDGTHVLVYFVGHGAFRDGAREYYLNIRRARDPQARGYF